VLSSLQKRVASKELLFFCTMRYYFSLSLSVSSCFKNSAFCLACSLITCLISFSFQTLRLYFFRLLVRFLSVYVLRDSNYCGVKSLSNIRQCLTFGEGQIQFAYIQQIRFAFAKLIVVLPAILCPKIHQQNLKGILSF